MSFFLQPLFNSSHSELLTASFLLLHVASFFLLKKGHINTAGIVLIIDMHWINFTYGNFLSCPMASLIALLPFPSFAFFAISTTNPLILNLGLCLFQSLIHMRNLREIFKITLTEQQSNQVFLGMITVVIFLFTFCSLGFIWKSIEEDLWKTTQENYEKSENLTKEVFQAVEAKDAFLSSLSCEVKNALFSLNQSLDYLLKVTLNFEHLQELTNAKLSGEILLNLVNNALDAARFRSGKIELNYTKANIEDIIKKVFAINSKQLAKKEIYAQAIIDSDLSHELWIDSDRILQILMNLFSNAIKFTPDKGKICIVASWGKISQLKDDLLSKMKNNIITEFINRESFDDDEDEDESGLENVIGPSSASPEEQKEYFEEFSSEVKHKRQRNFGVLQKTIPPLAKSLGSSPLLIKDYEKWNIKKIPLSEQHLEVPPVHLHGRGVLNQLQMESQKRIYLKIQVSDTGCGISDNDIPKIFGMFNKVHGITESANDGTGLGLWICKQLCQKMSGDITAYSKVNKGTDFVFYLLVNNEQITSTQQLPAIRPTREEIHALVVDDYAFNRNLHKLLLEKEGVQVTLACDGQEAVDRYKLNGNNFFDFIMMDVRMPNKNGFAAAKEIRDWEEENGYKKTNVYFVSGEYYSEEDVMMEFRSTGRQNNITGIRCIRKPIDMETIEKIVKKYHNKDIDDIDYR